MNTTKIIELFIDDMEDESGIEAISLVSRPAHDEKWLAFNKQEPEKVEEFSPYKIVDADFCSHNTKLDLLGEPYSKLINEGWDVVRVEKITPNEVYRMNRERFSNPNAESTLDKDTFRVRYKYVGPRNEKNRQFCREMLNKNKVYRIEDIDELTDSVANEEFGYYNIFLWRGSFNCRHVWVRLIYKKSGTIVNNANSRKGLEEVQGLGSNLQPDTRTKATIDNVGKPGSKQWKPGVPREGKSFDEKQRKPLSIDDMMKWGGATIETKKLFFLDDEKKTIVGAAMVPNKMIHRYDELGNLYYVFFSKQSIKRLADKFMKQKRTDETSVEHDGQKLGSDKVWITESWVSEDPVKDKSAAYGFNLPAGTWFVSMKVEDPKVWEMVKKKALTGFSVEGLFAEKSFFSKPKKTNKPK